MQIVVESASVEYIDKVGEVAKSHGLKLHTTKLAFSMLPWRLEFLLIGL